MEYFCQLPDPDDKEAWRQWIKVHSIAAVVLLVVIAAIFIFAKL
jgi:hypothetical protein